MCDIALGVNRDKKCTNSLGGNSELYLYNYLDDAFTVVDGIATAVNAGLTTVYKYVIEGDGNTLDQSMLGDDKVGTRVNTQTLVAQLKKIDGATSNELNKLAAGQISGVIKDRNGVYQALALDDGFFSKTINPVSGGAKVDFNGYNVTLVGETSALAPTLDSATATAFLALYTPTP
tara:strand:- start:15306 stop:15833 length:528 start_codon:yes stop_codon:yes gene_type:complete